MHGQAPFYKRERVGEKGDNTPPVYAVNAKKQGERKSGKTQKSNDDGV